MSCSTVEHLSHPRHPLVLKEDVVIGVEATCSVCNNPVLGSPTYTCTLRVDIGCQDFYLHKSCAELPKQIIRHKQDQHPLGLLPRAGYYVCDICHNSVKFSYACVDCDFDICVICAFAFEDRVISHQGHPEHTLTLLREALFKCDACWEKATDYSYVCLPCDVWIHKKCASSPPIIPAPTYHHHPLTLIFSIPQMHRNFIRYCVLCKEVIWKRCWSYYCQKCTLFVHLKCSTSTTEGNDIGDNEAADLVQFPLPDEESLLDLIITQCSKFLDETHGEGDNSSEPHIIEEHWSHWNHPLQLHQFTVDVDDDDNDDRRVLICDGCVQPISIRRPNYYACIECGFFLHSFCANKMPDELPVGASPLHPHHSLSLWQQYKFYSFVTCGICQYPTNGFYYQCQICDMRFDIRCVFLPTRIRHKSHKDHSLVQTQPLDKKCDASGINFDGMRYACETCSRFQISLVCAFYPSRMEHRYEEDHSLILRHPPFFYEGVFYCQICEEQVNNQEWLYNCEKCDQSFHAECVRWYESIKLGRRIKHSSGDQEHTLTLVIKKTLRKKSPPYLCGICGKGYRLLCFLECQGCGYLACVVCIRRVHGTGK
ncbi:hypothetical protein DCAR_0209752 [Daucus carota subsp. sativus]|uniref:Zinc finger PHD-type domain-containing protein n=1 Tax=Daucus carota subsp. sativus TaxID=79200 RepID=A0AAF1APM7_DAUCS|nr:hypothetical protein DCAR_0209752 [Daucus carota subsp. sativus]